MSMKYCLGRSVHAVRSIFMPAMVRAAAAPLESKVKGHQYYKHNAKVSTVYIYIYIITYYISGNFQGMNFAGIGSI